MSCADLVPLVEQHPLGLLEAADTERLEAHLAACEACRGLAAALAGAWTEVTAAAEAAGPAPAAQRERVIEAAASAARVDQEWMAGARRAASEGDDVKATLDDKKPGPGGPTYDAAKVDAVGARIALTCAYCHAKATRDDIAYCAACLAPHHAECFRAHGRCSLPGCGEQLTVRPGRLEAAPPRRRRWLEAGLGTVIVVAGGVAALNQLGPTKRDLAPGLPVPSAAEQAAIESTARARDLAVRAEALEVARRQREARELEARTPRVRLDFTDAPLGAVVAAIASQATQNIVIDSNMEERLTLRLVDVPWTGALRQVADLARCRIELRDGGILALTQPPRVTIQFTDANVRTVLQLAAAYSGKNVVIDASVTGTVTMDVKEVEWDVVLIAVCNSVRAPVHVLGELMVIGGDAPPGATPLRVPAWDGDLAAALRAEAPIISLVVTDRTIDRVAEELSRAAGRKVVVEGTVDAGQTASVELRDVSWRAAVDMAASRFPGWKAEHRADGAVLRRPPRITLRTDGAPVQILASMLVAAAAEEGRPAPSVIVPPDVRGHVSLDLNQLPLGDALNGLAAVVGAEVVTDGDGLLRLRLRGARPADGSPARPERASPRLEAVVVGPKLRAALIDSRVYFVGDPLLDANDEQIEGSQVVAIDPAGSVQLRPRAGAQLQHLELPPR